MSIWIRIGGYPATEIAAHTPPTWETWADGGCGTASWAFAISPRSQHQALKVSDPASLVEIMCGPMQIWMGVLEGYDRTTGECTAYGLAAEARNRYALDGAGWMTRDFGVAITNAIGRGWRVSNPAPVVGVAAGDADANPVSVAQLLDDYAEQTGQRWGVDGTGRLYMTPGAVEPMWVASPDSSAFGTTDEDVAGTLFGLYLDSTLGVNATAVAGAGSPEVIVDLTERGAMTNTAAVAVLNGALARDRAVTRWTNGVNLSRDQLQTFGGARAFLPSVRAGQVMRSFGLSYSSQALTLDTVIGKTVYTAGEDTIYIEPVNTAPRDLASVIAAA